MAGRAWYTYEADNGKKYAVNLSKNYEGSSLGFIPLTDPKLPRLGTGFRMRYLLAFRNTSQVGLQQKRKIYVGKANVAVYASGLPGQFTYGGQMFFTTGRVGESETFATLIDTGE